MPSWAGLILTPTVSRAPSTSGPPTLESVAGTPLSQGDPSPEPTCLDSFPRWGCPFQN